MQTLLMVVGICCGGLGVVVAFGAAMPGLLLVLIGAVCFVGGAVISAIGQLKLPPA